MDWNDTESLLEKLNRDLNQSWEHLRAIAKHETFTDSISTEKKMKSVKFLTEAAEKVKVLEVVHRRIVNRTRKLYLYMGMNASQAESQKVRERLSIQHVDIQLAIAILSVLASTFNIVG